MKPPYILFATSDSENELPPDSFPGNLPFTKDLHLEFESPVTFFVGENGSGKSTMLEAMAVLAKLPIAGGGMNEVGANQGICETSELAKSMRLAFHRHPKDRYFFRAESQAGFATLLDERKNDPYFNRDPFERYGGKSLHQVSHGEAFLAVMLNRFDQGLFLMDEPESSLSPQRQLTLLSLMHQLVENGNSQFFIATHSPILLTFPGAKIVSFDFGKLETVSVEETSHFQITRDILNNPEIYWQHLAQTPDDSFDQKDCAESAP